MRTLFRFVGRSKLVMVGLVVAFAAAVPAVARAATIVANNSDYVTFENGDGKWTIYKRCTATSLDTGDPYSAPHTSGVGPAYVAKYEAKRSDGGYELAVNGVDAGGNGEVNRAIRGGLGIFHWFHHRGETPLTVNDTWNMSNRRCASDQAGFGVVSWTTPSVFIDGSGIGHYDQDVFFSDGYSGGNKVLWVRYRWQFRGDPGGFINRLSSDAKLWVMVVQDCTDGACGSGPTTYMKAPKIANNINGKFSTNPPTHFSNFTTSAAGNKFITRHANDGYYTDCPASCVADTWGGSARACDAETTAAYRTNTGHCGFDGRARTRLDYGANAPGGTVQRGCNSSTQVCFNVVAMAYPLSGLDIVPGSTPTTFENGMTSGFDAWAGAADGRPNPGGPGAGGCGFFTGTYLTHPAQNDARSWEYFKDTNTQGTPITGYTILDKAWEECSTLNDAPELFRRFGGWDEAYGVYMDYSLDSGWSTAG
jgi:hypothetical protein